MDLDKLTQILHLVLSDDVDFELKAEGEDLVMEVNPERMALVIGKEGRNAKAFRELVYLYNKIHNTNYRLEIVEAGAEADETTET